MPANESEHLAATIEALRAAEATRRAIVRGVEAQTGDRFFPSLVQHLSAALDVQYAFVSEISEDRKGFRTLAVWGRGAFLPNFEVPLEGTPCEAVLGGELTHHPDTLQARFPADVGLADWSAESYAGVPLFDSLGAVSGHLAVIDDEPMPDGARAVEILRIFATRAGAELERLRVDTALRASEVRYRSLYENAPIAYVAYDVQRRVERVNPAFVELSGLSEAEVRGISYTAFAPAPEWEARYREAFDSAERDGVAVIEAQSRRRDGALTWLQATVRALRDEVGQLAGFYSLATDITSMKEAARALRESEALYRDLYEHAPLAYFTFGTDGVLRSWNARGPEITGFSDEELRGMSTREFHTDTAENRVAFARLEREVFVEGRDLVTEVEARRKDGTTYWARVSLSPLRDADGVIIGARSIAQDITELRRAQTAALESEVQSAYLQEEIKAAHNFEEIVGQSPSLGAVLAQVDLVARTGSSVLIVGETGTGKELIARAIHAAGSRRERPLIKVNCAALPTGLIESELFGHEKGAFSGAEQLRIGRFELAHGGTIFLDEIGEMPLEVQVKLLRVLQEREFERVGGNRTIPADARIIAATNRDLPGAIAAGTFRQDLYYRLNVFPISVPPLRARREDIPLLVHYFATRFTAKIGRKIVRVVGETMERLIAYSWPGNVRELENVIERAVILSSGTELQLPPEMLIEAPPEPALADVPPAARPVTSPAASSPAEMPTTLEQVERSHIISVLEQTRWRIDGPHGAARALNLNPSTLRSRLKKLGIQRSRAPG